MGLEYLKITPEIMLKISAYDAEAQGRLVMAMIAYALNGDEPEFEGMEKFIWPVLKLDIDRCAASIEKQAANGSRGGRPRQSQAKTEETQGKPSETKKNPEKPRKTQDKPSESLNSNTNSNSNTNNQEEEEEERACAREGAPASSPADDSVIGIDGTDLSAEIALNAEVDVLLRQYKLSESVRGGLMDEITKHGLDKVKRVMQEAAESDTKGGLSLRFIRACLVNDGKSKPVRSSPGQQKEQMMRYSPEDRKATYSAAIVDFDEVG